MVPKELAGQIGEICQEVTQVVPFVVDVPGTISKDLSALQDALGIPDITGSVQVAVLRRTAHALGNVLYF